MTEPIQSPQELNKIIGFFRTKKSKYIFVILEDERLLNDILVPVIAAYEKKGLEVLHFPLKLTDYYVFQQIENIYKSAYHSGLQGLIVSGLNELIDKYGETFIDNLNRSRDAFQRIAVPIVWIIDQKNLQRIIQGASDFYQMRDLSDFYIRGASKITNPRLDINLFYNPYPGDKDIDESYLERQLSGILIESKYEKETINGFVLPLLRRYIHRGDIDKMKNLYRSFLKNHEEIVDDPYILVSYYTAIGELDQSPLFPRRFVQPIFPGHSPVPGEDLHSEGLLKIIAEKKGVIAVTGDDCRVKSQLIAHTLGKLKNQGYDFIVIYGETTPELILFNTALKAKEKNDENALKIFTGDKDIEEKTDYFIEGFLSRNKITIIFLLFEENQSEALGGECKSRRLKIFLNRFREMLRGKDSFLFLSACLPIRGFPDYTIPGEPNDAALTGKKIEDLPSAARRILEILSLFHKPVHPEVLRFYDINPEDLDVFYSLEKSSLLEIIPYPGEENKKDICLFVPPFVSRLVQKSLDNQKKTDFHLKAGRYFENYFIYFTGADVSYIEIIMAARRHFIEAKAWDNAAELILKLFWPLHAQNFTQWALDLLNELEIEGIKNTGLKYHVQRRLGLLHYYKGAYYLSWENYKEALGLVADEDERYRLYSELLPVELSVNPVFNSTDRSVFKGIFHTLPDSPPMEIIQAGTNALLNYYSQINVETTYLAECKIFLVGSGGVGKTTLMKRLQDNHFTVIPDQETTHGIHIVPWKLVCAFANRKTLPVKIHFWDFGGQDILYTTHQFFLTKRSLYLFVWEARKEEESRSFDYWLNIIKLLCASSPVFIVMNKADIRTQTIDEASFQKKFPNIRAFIQVSCITGKGIAELTELIRASLSLMPHLLDRLPKTWLQIRDDLKNQNKDYISRADYLAICEKRGLDREKAGFLSDYLHDLGAILHFGSDPFLAETVILNLGWATAAVYQIMYNLAIINNKGRFQYEDLKTYWDLHTFPEEKHPQLLRLMEKFELCFPVPGTKIHIVPELLPAEPPDLKWYKYRKPTSLRFEYHYDFMPRGILSRFITRLYYLIRGDRYWKHGVELALENTYALVVAEPLLRKLTVTVIGPGQSELLAVIRDHLDYIHRSLNMEKDDHYREMIPCNCGTCRAAAKPHLHRHGVLKRFIEKGIKEAQCQESGEPVLISGLLKGYAPPAPKTDLTGVLPALIKTAAQLQGIAKTIKPDEDSRNSFIALLLTIQGYRVKDQTRRGSSAGGKKPGELDILIETPDGTAESVIEAFNIKGLDRGVIASHFKKLFGYDANGLENNYILVYAENVAFVTLWQEYLDYLPDVEVEYPMQGAPVEEKTPYADIKLARTVHHRHNRETTVYHLFINMTP